MSKFRKIETSFWRDPFIESLTPEQKYFYIYLLTNPATKQCGIYEITVRNMAYETGFHNETIEKYLEYFEKSNKIVYNRQTNELCIVNFLKYNNNSSPKVQTCIKSELSDVKDKVLIQYLYSIDALSQEEKEKEKEKEKEEEQFIPSAFSNEFLTDITHNVTDYDEAGTLTDDHKRTRANLMLKAMHESDSKIENLEMLYKKSKAEIKHAITTFNDSQYAADNVSRNYKEHWRHFVNWFKKSINK